MKSNACHLLAKDLRRLENALRQYGYNVERFDKRSKSLIYYSESLWRTTKDNASNRNILMFDSYYPAERILNIQDFLDELRKHANLL